ncbi:type II secretion system GspH family protein [bacterium]|nr:type II secretion system GspH family protein [bacterium]
MPAKKLPGFTLIELLLVVAIIGILSGILAMVLKPDYYMADARNARRRVDSHAISLTVSQYYIGTGNPPVTITDTQTEICKTGAANCIGLIDLSVLTDAQGYLTTIPNDPKYSTENGTGYSIYRNEFGRFVITAVHAEKGETIEVIR